MAGDAQRRSGTLAVIERALKLAFVAVSTVAVGLIVLADWMIWDALAMGLLVVAALAPLTATDGGGSGLIDLKVDMERGQAGTHRPERPRGTAITPLGVFVVVSIPLALIGALIAR